MRNALIPAASPGQQRAMQGTDKRNPLAPQPLIPLANVGVFLLVTLAVVLVLHFKLVIALFAAALVLIFFCWLKPTPGCKCRVHTVRIESRHDFYQFPVAPALPPLPWQRSRGWWTDASGRKIIPYGLNFSGSCKLPAKPPELGKTQIQAGDLPYSSHRDVSYVGRPCPLEDCREHLSRMCACGCTLLRLLVPWEALEHAGPMQYDEEYIAYIRNVCEIAADVGIFVWIDPHQDCWSRFTGGSGAPGWTLEVCGMQVSRALHTSRAADLHWEYEDPARMPHLKWPANNRRLACGTMYTVFYAGDRYCPHVEPYWGHKNQAPPELAGLSLQKLLQECYIRCFENLASKLVGLQNVLGFEVMNEPSMGLVGNRDLSEHVRFPLSIDETPFQSMVLADRQIWNNGCLWRRAGVWDYVDGQPKLKNKKYFLHTEPVGEFMPPFVKQFAERIRKVMSHAEVIVCPPAFGEESEEVWPRQSLAELRAYGAVSVHKYDEIILDQKMFVPGFTIEIRNIFSMLYRGVFSNVWNPGLALVFGVQASIQAMHRSMWAKRTNVDGAFAVRLPSTTWAVPAIVSETGISMDVRGLHVGAWNPAVQTQALDRTMRAVDAGFWPVSIWNYALENSNKWGDNWNLENLSVCSPEGSSGIDWDQRPWVKEPEKTFKHLRALSAWVRPRVVLLAGNPVHQVFDLISRTYTLVWQADPRYQGEEAIVVVFLPLLHFGGGFKVEASSGLDYSWDPPNQTLKIIESDSNAAGESQRQREEADFKLVVTATDEAQRSEAELQQPLVASHMHTLASHQDH